MKHRGDSVLDTIRHVRKVFGRSPFYWIGLATLLAPFVTLSELGLGLTLHRILIFLGGPSGVAPPLLFIPQTASDSLVTTTALFCVLGILRAALQLTIGWAAGVNELSARARLRQLSLGQLLLAPARRPAPLSEPFWIETVIPRAALYLNRVTALFPQVGVTAGLLVGMAFIDVPMTLAALLLVTGLGLWVRRLGDTINRETKRHLAPSQDLSKGVGQVRRNWIFMTIMGAKGIEYERLTNLNLRSTKFALRAHLGGVSASVLPEIGGILVLGVLLLAQGRFSIGRGAMFVPFVYLLIRVVQSLTRIAELFGYACQLNANFRQALEAFSTLDESTIADSLPPMRDNLAASPPSAPTALPTVELESLSFSYPESEEILTDLSLVVRRGEQIGLVGPSGCGKSTVVSLIVGLQTPTRGRILIDGLSPQRYLGEENSAVGYVGAEPFLISGTLRDNLAYGQIRCYTESDYREALIQAQLSRVIARLPGGLDYTLTENGEGLSAGEKQRLALARALLRRPRLLILDELTANLDKDTEREIALALRAIKGTCTCLIVSHKMGILCFADRVFDLEKKSWLGRGPSQKLYPHLARSA